MVVGFWGGRRIATCVAVYPSFHRLDVFGTSMGPLVFFFLVCSYLVFRLLFFGVCVFFLLLLVLVVLHESEHRFALLNIITSAKFLSIFRNVKNSCLVSLWSSTCYFICYMGGGGGGGTACVHCDCVSVCVRERDCMCAMCV